MISCSLGVRECGVGMLRRGRNGVLGVGGSSEVWVPGLGRLGRREYDSDRLHPVPGECDVQRPTAGLGALAGNGRTGDNPRARYAYYAYYVYICTLCRIAFLPDPAAMLGLT